MPDIPLEIKTLIIHELSPYGSLFVPARHVEDEKAAYFRDLCAVCLVWPDTIAIIRKVIFRTISLRSNDHHIDVWLHNLCQALDNDPSLPTFVKTLEFSHRNTNSLLSPFIPTASRSLFLSFLSFIPKMHKLRFLHLDNMCFHDETSIEFNDLCVLKESSVTDLTLRNSTFSIPAFNVFLGYWRGRELYLSVDGISLIPHTTYTSDQMLLEIHEDTWDWDEEITWTEWEVEKPRTASFVYATTLQLHLSNSLECGMLMLMDLLASYEWSPLDCVYNLEIFSEDAITATTVIRINTLIRRYEPVSYLGLNFFSNEFEDAIGTPLYLGGLERTVMGFRIRKDFTLFELDEDCFEWHIESLTAVPPNSELRELTLGLSQLVPLEAVDFKGSQGIWRRLDGVLSGDNLQFETLIIDVYLKPSPNGARTPGLAQLQTWLMEICFPKVTAKYFSCNKEETEGREMSELRLWIGDEQVDPKKH